jgi:para-aminobenzoate synthetase component 1
MAGPEMAGGAAQFDGAARTIRADDPAEVPAALAALESARAAGKWLAGYASYELGYALEDKLAAVIPEGRRLPLLCFGVFDGPEPVAPLPDSPARIGPLRPRWGADQYRAAYARVHDWIGAGDIYQANLTFPVDAPVAGESAALYAALAARQPVGHGVLVEQDGLPDILSRSPELFFRIHADGRLETLPMKGTVARGDSPEADALARAHLSGDVKNRAENLMIVDLLRNDLSRIAEVGSVRVPELFHVQTYTTVHQMVSRVVGQLRPGVGLGEVLAALYPCGSITGAPKLRAMQIIRELEAAPREAYCGTIGWAAPDGRAEFNVAIRTLLRAGDTATLNVGGGVVWDSTAADEYDEALLKASFAVL